MVSCTLRFMSMIGIGIAQEAIASTILNSPSMFDDAVIRHERRTKYKRWIWWTRFVLGIYVVQFLGATYLMFIVAKYIIQNGKSGKLISGSDAYRTDWDRSILMLLIIIPWFLVTFQCVTGSEVRRAPYMESMVTIYKRMDAVTSRNQFQASSQTDNRGGQKKVGTDSSLNAQPSPGSPPSFGETNKDLDNAGSDIGGQHSFGIYKLFPDITLVLAPDDEYRVRKVRLEVVKCMRQVLEMAI